MLMQPCTGVSAPLRADQHVHQRTKRSVSLEVHGLPGSRRARQHQRLFEAHLGGRRRSSASRRETRHWSSSHCRSYVSFIPIDDDNDVVVVVLLFLDCSAGVGRTGTYIAVAVTIAKLNYASAAAIHNRPPIQVRFRFVSLVVELVLTPPPRYAS